MTAFRARFNLAGATYPISAFDVNRDRVLFSAISPIGRRHESGHRSPLSLQIRLTSFHAEFPHQNVSGRQRIFRSWCRSDNRMHMLERLTRPRIKRGRSHDGADAAPGIDQPERGRRNRIDVILGRLEILHRPCLPVLHPVASDQAEHVKAEVMRRMPWLRGRNKWPDSNDAVPLMLRFPAMGAVKRAS